MYPMLSNVTSRRHAGQRRLTGTAPFGFSVPRMGRRITARWSPAAGRRVGVHGWTWGPSASQPRRRGTAAGAG